jgi:hypothetical protein
MKNGVFWDTRATRRNIPEDTILELLISSQNSLQIAALNILAHQVFEKLTLERLKPISDEEPPVPRHQFGFRKIHSTMDRVHRITDIIKNSLENKGVCSAVFLDIAQAFDRVWHRGLLHKLG